MGIEEVADMPSDKALHPGITMHQIQVGGGVAGAIFTVGSMLVFLTGVPLLWYFFAGAIALGVGVAVLLRQTHDEPLNLYKL